MHSPSELARRLARQWDNNPDLRETRLIDETAWPIKMPIGRPPARMVADHWQAVAAHLKAWRSIRTGCVIWEPATYRATGEAAEIPIAWELGNAEEWVKATDDRLIAEEFAALRAILRSSDPLFHSLLIRQRSLWKEQPLAEILKAAELAAQLQPGSAHGAPLRALSLAGIDSKFFERHRGLLIRLLDLRFDGEASRQGLEVFLNAWQELDHWLLLVDLDEGLLTFSQQRVRSSELPSASLTAQRLLVVENERCLHLLPRPLPGTIAILGAGNNLAWLDAPWLKNIEVAYWGDIDTWGLTLLANARRIRPDLKPLLMNRAIFDQYEESSAVAETVLAGTMPPEPLSPTERDLYRYLQTREKGRLEQEFLAAKEVAEAVLNGFSAMSGIPSHQTSC